MDGFIRFRLPLYRQELYLNLCEAMEEFYIEKEYEDFIKLLSEYIQYKQPLIDLIHIKTEFDGEISFYDFTKSKIELSVENDDVCNPIENFLTKDDILISILIALAPKRIIWHKTEFANNQNILNTIKSIFGERFSVCDGCELCDE